MKVSFSIIVCTYNPEEIIFLRLLNALLDIEIHSNFIDYEIIIIDNNSNIPITSLDYVINFRLMSKAAMFIVEREQGLTSARIAGILAAKYDWLIFFDDDNEPRKNYLAQAEKEINLYKNVGAFGPGIIEVKYFSKPNRWLNENKHLFQQRNEQNTILGNDISSQSYYPDGTGLIILKSIALNYVKKVTNGTYTLTDRFGKSLSSGGDLQICLNTALMGFSLGRSQLLKLNHNICGNKTNFKNILKMLYGVESCNYKAHNEVLLWDSNQLKKFQYTNSVKVLKMLYYYFVVSKSSFKDSMVNYVRFVGQQKGISVLKNEKHPSSIINISAFFINR